MFNDENNDESIKILDEEEINEIQAEENTEIKVI